MNKFYILFLFIYSTSAWSDDFDCNKAVTTFEINHCAGVELEKYELEMDIYLTKSKAHNSNDPELIKTIDIAQKAWEVYVEAHCGSVFTKWRDGTIRGVMSLSCKINITKQRTHEIWTNFLTYMDSTPPVLPEPKR